jgi:hypothetical protein
VRTPGSHYLATDDNLGALRRIRDDTAGVPAPQRAKVAELLPRFEAARGAAPGGAAGGWAAFGGGGYTGPAVLARPRRVAVLADGGCASSCEEFLLEARRSRKATLYGAPSAGLLDYSNVVPADAAAPSAAGPGVPGSTLTLVSPTTRSARLPTEPVDNVGVPPAVPLPADEPLPVDWVRRHLEAADAAGRTAGRRSGGR